LSLKETDGRGCTEEIGICKGPSVSTGCESKSENCRIFGGKKRMGDREEPNREKRRRASAKV